LQGTVYNPKSKIFLKKIGIRKGINIAIIGAGTGELIQWISKKVGKIGNVYCTDISTKQIDVLRELIRKKGLTNTKCLVDDITKSVTSPLSINNFDIVYCRWVLAHLQNPRNSHTVTDAIKGMVRLTKSGGIIACEEGDVTTFSAVPPTKAFNEFCELTNQLRINLQLNTDLGAKISSVIKKIENLVDVRSYKWQPTLQTEEAKLMIAYCIPEGKKVILEHTDLNESEIELLYKRLLALAKNNNISINYLTNTYCYAKKA